MTNEEAAHILHAIKFILPSRFYKDYIEEALNMGMDALKERTKTHECVCDREETHEERTEGDCISREAAIQAVTHFDDSLKRLYELPSVNQWIPTSERLPQHFNEVLLSFETMFRTIVTIGHLVKSRDGLMWSIVEYYFPFDINDVKAWMELPEPYEEEKNEKDTNTI